MKRKIFGILFALVLVLSFTLVMATPAMAIVEAPSLGTAASFAVLGGATVTITGTTPPGAVVTGDVGSTVSPVVQTAPLTINGVVHENDPAANTAYADFLDAYDAITAVTTYDETLTSNLAGVTLAPGVYNYDAAATLTGILTLDASDNASAVWIFKIGTGGTGALTTTDFDVVFATDNGSASNVFWWVKQGATFTDSNILGNILAGVDITVTRGSFMGNVQATGAVTVTGPGTIESPAGGPAATVELWHDGTLSNTYVKIQNAINAAVSGDTIKVPAGTYEEDLSIPADKDNLELVGATGATIKGVAITASGLWPLAAPNIEILADGVSIHGFIIQGPDPDSGYYSSGMVIGGSSVEIYDNAFEVTNTADGTGADVSQGLQTYHKLAVPGVDISGLNIHDNTFTHLGGGTVGFEAIYINRDEGTGNVIIADNVFTGYIVRGITTERSNTIINGNSLDTDATLILSGILIRDAATPAEPQDLVTVNENTMSGFTEGVLIGNSAGTQVLTNISITNNTVQSNLVGIKVRSSADGVVVNYNSINGNDAGVQNTDAENTLDARYNWWGNVAGPWDNGPDIYINPYQQMTGGGDHVYGDVVYTPWLIQSELAEGWNIWSRPITPDEDSWLQMQNELVEAGIEAIYYFDSATQLWGLDPDTAGPLDAFYIKMTDDSRIRYYFSAEATFPSQKAMRVGWNFIGLAELYPVDTPFALLDIYFGTGGPIPGYTKVICPSLNGVSWTYLVGGNGDGAFMYPTKGYWVFMVNNGVLGGFTTTPIVEIENT